MPSLSDLPAEYLGKAAKMILAQTDSMHQDQEVSLRDQRNRLRDHQRKMLGLPEAVSEGDEMRIVADNITISQPPPQPPPSIVSQGLSTLSKMAIAAGLLSGGGAIGAAGKYVIDRLTPPAVSTPADPISTTINRGWLIDVGSESQ